MRSENDFPRMLDLEPQLLQLPLLDPIRLLPSLQLLLMQCVYLLRGRLAIWFGDVIVFV